MGIISGETDRLIHLVEELLDFSRLQSNHFNLYKTKGSIVRYTRGDDLAINS